MKIYRLNNHKDFENFLEATKDEYLSHLEYLDSLLPQTNTEFKTKGFSYTAGQEVDFICDFKYSSGFPNINWRESIVCPISGLNNRMRAALQIFDIFSNVYHSDKFYIMEKCTTTYEQMKQKYPFLIGSEFLGNATPLGELDEKGIRNEDATNLTFQSSSLAAVLSFDVFEHIYEYKLAFQECYRVLKPGACLILTVPFDVNSAQNIERAVVGKNGDIEHLLPAEYHGDPLSKNGILCFRSFGWQIIQDLKDSGFKQASALIFNSIELGYYTNQIIFYCEK